MEKNRGGGEKKSGGERQKRREGRSEGEKWGPYVKGAL